MSDALGEKGYFHLSKKIGIIIISNLGHRARFPSVAANFTRRVLLPPHHHSSPIWLITDTTGASKPPSTSTSPSPTSAAGGTAEKTDCSRVQLPGDSFVLLLLLPYLLGPNQEA
jgi:hypothetical protein